MARAITDYSLDQDFQKKFYSFDKLNKELKVISQLIEHLRNTEKADENKKKELMDRNEAKLGEVQRLGQDVARITSVGGMIKICSLGLVIISDFHLIYEQLYFNKSVDKHDFTALYKRIMSLMENKAGVKQLKGGDEIVEFLNNIGLSEADYRPALEKWLQAFFEDDSLISRTSVGYIYTINRIDAQFSYNFLI